LTLGLALRRPLSTGDVVRSTDIGEKPAVAEMTPVSIRVKVGAVDISSNGVALANAQVGEQVKVRSNLSRQILLARVVGPQSVVVDEGDLR
jgi:flagella basal body P-ring formation protein FlgA